MYSMVPKCEDIGIKTAHNSAELSALAGMQLSAFCLMHPSHEAFQQSVCL